MTTFKPNCRPVQYIIPPAVDSVTQISLIEGGAYWAEEALCWVAHYMDS